ncbi:MAG: RNA-binding domain-containing protein [Candidatus Heimdallarchaeaceae archaeon]
MKLKISISIRVPFYSTEDKSKLEDAIRNLLGELPPLIETKVNDIRYLVSDEIKINSLRPVFKKIRQNEILDTVRRYSLIYPQAGKVIFIIHKQALYVNKIAVITKDTTSPLGNVELIVHTKDTEKFLDWFAPETLEGRILNPSKFNDIFNL